MRAMRHNDMNFYAASVALLWTTAMQVSTVSRVRRPRQELLRACAAAAPGGTLRRLLRGFGRRVGFGAS
jgi:hypothetical protein